MPSGCSQFIHYLWLAFRVFLRNPFLAALIVLTLGIGIGASMTLVTVVHVMSSDPLPSRSNKLFFPHFAIGPSSYADVDPGKGFTWPDAFRLLRAHRAVRQAVMVGGRLAVDRNGGLAPFFEEGRYVSSEFFSMFGSPFVTGRGWSLREDNARRRIVVLNSGLAIKLFGSDRAAMGQIVQLQNHDFRVIGVLRDWHPRPLFYGNSSGAWAFKSEDGFFIPLTTAMSLNLPVSSGETCWGEGGKTSNQCTWLQFWVELDTQVQVEDYHKFLMDYWHEQKEHDRFPQDMPPQLYGLMQKLRRLDVVPSDIRLQLWLAIGFLCACLFNTTCLMLAKFLYRSGEISSRRSMGASRRDIFFQFGIEAVALGLTGGILGLLLTWCGLWLVRQQPEIYAKMAYLDTSMVVATFVMAVFASVLAGLLPAWRACRIPPALHLKVF